MKEKQALTEKEQAVLDYIEQEKRRLGYSPAMRDIQAALGFRSTSTVSDYINRLAEKGYINKVSGKSRAISTNTVASHTRGEALEVPLVGEVAAGVPILAVENIERHISFQSMRHHYHPNELYALRVKGNSMIEAGISSGDIVIVKKQEIAENGDMVVALIEDEATVKTFYKENGHFRLQPENHTMKPIIVDELLILGKVIACMKYFD